MATSFSSLPIVDLSILSSPTPPSPSDLKHLSTQLYNVFATTGFAYLTNAPLSFSQDDVFSLAREFFCLSNNEKLRLAKQTFVKTNTNTYRGYFPPQPGQLDNLKEGFEIGSAQAPPQTQRNGKQKFVLGEPNVWPDESSFPSGREKLEQLYAELQTLASNLLSLLAVSLDKDPEFFRSYLDDSLSTLRLLHYPPQPASTTATSNDVRLCCTPHTDSGIMTLLHQDPTGGLEVLNADGKWVAAPYIPGSLVVNIGDLLARVSGGRFVATKHRVRTSAAGTHRVDDMGRFSVPFFFEPGEDCLVTSVDGGAGVLYGEYVKKKMGTWVEYQDEPEERPTAGVSNVVAVEA